MQRLLLTLSPLTLVTAVTLIPAGAGRAETPAGPRIDFQRQIRPILSDNCFACHGPDDKQRKAKLRLDTRDGAFRELNGGGFAVVPGKPDESELVDRVFHDDPSRLMPPPKSGKKLSPQQRDLLRQWVAQGAPWSEHWAFAPPRPQPLPRVANGAWPNNPIDHFILARLERGQLRPSPPATKNALIRRVTLDLTGLPPTPQEVADFLADPAPDAYERVVDRLLQTPAYAEHMTRFWLDAARYGDTHGLHLDNYREIWPYRDWVIRAFRDNKPYDQFLLEQLAGDLLPNASLDQQIATGFLRCHVTTSEGGSIEEEVYVRNVVDRVETNGTVLLGLTVGCARCHDHKFDPVTMKDFYGLFAFFNSIDGKDLDGNAAAHPPVVRVGSPELVARIGRVEERMAPIQKKIAGEVAQLRSEKAPDSQEPEEVAKDKKAYNTLAAWVKAQRAANAAGLPRPFDALVKQDDLRPAQRQRLRDYFLEHAYAPARARFEPLHKELAALEKEKADLEKQVPTSLVFKEAAQPRPSYLLKRGEYDQRGDRVERATPAFLPPFPSDAPKNRLGLARWLLDPQHPLTARVAVNRLWQQVFGIGLVKTAEDFGSQGEPPSHPELLDWLALRFQADGWDVKKSMKRLVMSATYRQSSRVTPDRLAGDRENRLLSRGPRFRLDAETLRDQALFVSGLLVARVGGPSVKPPQPSGIWEAVGYTGSNTARFTADTGHERVHRRSLYTFWKRTAPPPQMSITDAPSREACTVRRERTNTPLQALLLLNETQYVEAARALAERTLREGGKTSEERLNFLFLTVTARHPTAREGAELLATYRDHRAEYARDAEAARKLIAVGETKPDPTLDPGDLATWTLLANLVLNLDEVVTKG